MEFDAGVVVGLVFILGFIGAIAWAEIHTRRQRRQRVGNPAPPAPPPPGPRGRGRVSQEGRGKQS